MPEVRCVEGSGSRDCRWRVDREGSTSFHQCVFLVLHVHLIQPVLIHFSLSSKRCICSRPLITCIRAGNACLCNNSGVFVSQQLSFLDVWRELLPHHTKRDHHSPHRLLPVIPSPTWRSKLQWCIDHRRCNYGGFLHSHDCTSADAGAIPGGYSPLECPLEAPPDHIELSRKVNRSALRFRRRLANCGLPCSSLHQRHRSGRLRPFPRICRCARAKLRRWRADVDVLELRQGIWTEGNRHGECHSRREGKGVGSLRRRGYCHSTDNSASLDALVGKEMGKEGRLDSQLDVPL